ncbi:hypothetical protein BJX99DRAFT_260191 [Aspergillus californicus]
MALVLGDETLKPANLQLPVIGNGVEDEAQAEAQDNWTGLADAKERRKRQNRLNQRALRQRRRTQQKKPMTIQDQIEALIASGEVTLVPRRASLTATTPSVQNDSISSATQWERRSCFIGDEIDKLLEQFSERAIANYVNGTPFGDSLLTLSKVNVFRAFIGNMIALGMSPGPEWMMEEALSPFSTLLPGYARDDELPPSLRPTPLQRTELHHPWLDFFPFPRLRDNLISAGDFDDHPLCLDIMGFWDVTNESCGMLVWGDPTDPRNWEVSETFLQRWPWVVSGCPELMASTNRWRSQRGEKMIFRYL